MRPSHREQARDLYVETDRHNVIAGNSVTVALQHGSAIHGSVVTGDIRRNVIVRHATDYAIRLDGMSGTFEGNLVVDNAGAETGTAFLGGGGDERGNVWVGNDYQYLHQPGGPMENNVFWGNKVLRMEVTMGGNYAVVNNTFGAPTGTIAGLGTLYLQGSTYTSDVANNIFYGRPGGYGIQESLNIGVAPVVSNNLFEGNGGGDHRDKYGNVWSGAVEVNANVAGASNNVDGDPLFATGPSGAWTSDGTYDGSAYRTTLTDTGAAFTPGALAGMILNPKTSQGRCFYVVDNTATAIVVWGDASPASTLGTTNGAAYEVLDFHLQLGSPAQGTATAFVAAVPATDYEGDPRPGMDFLIDIGADEIALPDLGVTKTASADPVVVGEQLTYAVTVTNGGDGVMSSATLSDPLPTAYVSFTSATPTVGSCGEAGGTVTCDLGDLDPGTLESVEIVVGVIAPGSFDNTATATGTGVDPIPGNDADTVGVTALAPSIGDRVWLDDDGDGIQDAGESGFANIEVRLYDSSYFLVQTRLTDAVGDYAFTGLTYGQGYYVRVVLPSSSYAFSPRDLGADDGLDSDVDPITGVSSLIVVQDGTDPSRWDAGVGPACVPPDETIYLYGVTLDGNNNPVLNFMDPNQPNQTTGYNVYRSNDPAPPPSTWPRLASNVVDMDQGSPNNQWVDASGDPPGPPYDAWFYHVTAVNSRCPAEGPF